MYNVKEKALEILKAKKVPMGNLERIDTCFFMSIFPGQKTLLKIHFSDSKVAAVLDAINVIEFDKFFLWDPATKGTNLPTGGKIIDLTYSVKFKPGIESVLNIPVDEPPFGEKGPVTFAKVSESSAKIKPFPEKKEKKSKREVKNG